MCIAKSLIDYPKNKESITITNLDHLPHGAGCGYLLVIESPYPGEYIAEKWLRKLPQSCPNHKRVIRF